ncbi:MAG: sodium:proton antiporter [Paludibacteraceae bacterium]|nr:sodium:proton antiporter [Paludibacteraceae bacterium]
MENEILDTVASSDTLSAIIPQVSDSLTAVATTVAEKADGIPGWMLIPFAVMLLCIAILPLIPHVGEWWEHNTHKLYVSLILGVPVGIWLCMHGMSHDLMHQMIGDYVPFILLLMALFVTTGGICIRGDLKATPIVNTSILAIGWVLASFMGTTGAAMLLIRLLLSTNQQRKYRVHTVLFFIAIVANCGGLLSPLGDPPLFLLFLKGADFTWWMQNMVGEWLVTGGLLLAIYFLVDWYLYRKEPTENLMADVREATKTEVSGLINIFWLICVVAATMFINDKYIDILKPENYEHGHVPMYIARLREYVFILIIAASWLTTKKAIRVKNNYSWVPIMEVACVFLGIFATMTPALMYLSDHKEAIAEFINAPWQYVYATGLLSSFLDNAPTAMVFNEMAAPEGLKLATDEFLKAISMGAVFFGAMTYIGNGPNFMVKSIAEQEGISMPSFFGYMIKFSLIVLLPVYIIVQLIFI